MEGLSRVSHVPVATQLDDDILKPAFREQLCYMKQRCNSETDREKCDFLAASLTLSEDINKQKTELSETPARRAKTAMAAIGFKKNWDPYETSHKREFVHGPNSSTQAYRPKSSKAYRFPYELGDPVGASLYSQEFCWKPFSKPDHIRSGSASGNRRNNPHPSESFLIWQLPRQEKQISEDSRSPWKNLPSEEEIRRALTAQYCSTYKADYLGIPQGFQVKHAIPAPLNWKKDIPHSHLTNMRYHYQQPKQTPELLNTTTRYGCNTHHHLAAKGVVPSVTYAHIRNQENRKQPTTYERHFGDGRTDISTVLRSLKPQEIQHFLQSVPDKVYSSCEFPLKFLLRLPVNSTDKEVMKRFLRTVTLASQGARTKNLFGILSTSKQT